MQSNSHRAAELLQGTFLDKHLGSVVVWFIKVRRVPLISSGEVGK